MRHGDVAWLTLAAAILTYEMAAPRDELLSEAVDRYRRRHPFITEGLICYLALHLLRRLPDKIDPLHQIAIRWPR